MKKFLAMLLALVMALSLVACGSKDNNDTPDDGKKTNTIKVGLICIGDENDQGYTYNFIRGKEAATEQLAAKGINVDWVVKYNIGEDSTCEDANIELAEEGCELIINNSFGAVKVNSVSIEAAQGWSLAAFGSKDTLAHEKVNSNKFGFQIALGNGEKKLTDSKNASKQTLLDAAVEGCYMSGVGDTSANTVAITYDAIVTPVSEAVTNTAIASVLFIIAWDAV